MLCTTIRVLFYDARDKYIMYEILSKYFFLCRHSFDMIYDCQIYNTFTIYLYIKHSYIYI